MKICLYSPYVPKHRGGGEMYLLQVASILLKKHDVYLAISEDWFSEKKPELEAIGLTDLSDEKIIAYYTDFFDVPIEKLKIIHTPLGTKASFLKKWLWTRQWDLLYYLTDGSTFPSFARKNIMHIQIPLQLDKSTIWERLKLSTWQVKNTNSHFTKEFVSKKWPVHIEYVHSPFVELPDSFLDAVSTGEVKKTKTIVHIGRFFKQLHSKRQDKIIDTFIKMCKTYPEDMKGWKLQLIGGSEDQSYVESLHEKAKGFPIEFHHKSSREQVLRLLQRARIYWHATGFGIDQSQHPEKVEHFGISTIEAMALGCIPVVISAGGQPEILGEELSECLWNTQTEWIEKTLHIMNDDYQEKKLRTKAIQQSSNFSKKRFASILELMLHS